MDGMKRWASFLVCTLLLVIDGKSVLSDNDTATDLDNKERALGTLKKANNFFKESPYTSGIGDLAAASLTAIGQFATNDYNKPSEELVKDIGDSIVPIMAMGMALIPGMGPLISGVFSGVWSLCSNFFGKPEKSPMEKLVEHITSEFKAVRKEMKQLRDEILKTTEKMMEQKLGKYMATVLYGEIDRNKYICDKYSLVSHHLSAALRKNLTVSGLRRLEVMMYLHDCDNFLKDTESAFMHKNMADFLWIPSVITSLARVSFMTEVISYGGVLKIEKVFQVNFFQAYKQTIVKQFAFYNEYNAIRVFSISKTINTYFGPFMPEELETCKMQGQMLYLDRELYPYGIPQKTVVSGQDAHVDLTKFKNATTVTQHVQVFYNDYRKTLDNIRNSVIIFNCFMGPVTARVLYEEWRVKVTFATNKNYKLRLVYFEELGKAGLTALTDEKPYREAMGADREMYQKVVGTTIDILITDDKSKTDAGSKGDKRFAYNATYYQGRCSIFKHVLDEDCDPTTTYSFGNFVIYSTEPVAVLPSPGANEKKLDGKISIKSEKTDVEDDESQVSMVGFEVIAFPMN